MKKISLLLAVLSISTAFAQDSLSASTQTTAKINKTCTVSATSINFGEIPIAKTGYSYSTGSFSLLCTRGTSWSAFVSVGQNGYAEESNSTNGFYVQNGEHRAMKGMSPSNTQKNILQYNVFTSQDYTKIYQFKNYGSGKQFYSGQGTGIEDSRVLYARISLNQFVTPDNYTDTLTLTLEY